MNNKKKLLLYNWMSGGQQTPEINPEYDGVVSYYSLNDSGRDYFYGLHNSYMVNGATPDTGKIGNCYTFLAGSVIIPTGEDNSFGSGGTDRAFTISMWLYPTEAAAQRTFLYKGNSSSVNEFQMTRDTSGRISVFLFTNGSNYLGVRTNAGFAANSWYFVAVTYNANETAGGIVIKVNDAVQAVTSIGAGTYTGMSATDPSCDLFIANASATNTNTGFRGKIDTISIFDSVLSDARLTALYNGGNGVALTNNTVLPTTDVYEQAMFVLATRGSYQFGTDNRYLYWSDDNGKTWINQKDWGNQYSGHQAPIYNKAIDFSFIFADGTVIFSVGSVLYRSTDKLLNISTVTVYNADGVTPYTIHTPANAIYPGQYFSSYTVKSSEDVDGNEMLIWGNYCNNASNRIGVAPVNIWYTIDKGVTVKTAYQFGQNPNFRDNGTAGGSTSTGTLLGDALNPLYTKHVHAVVRRPGTNDWYVCTGDSTNENHWLKLAYNSGLDTFTPTTLLANTGISQWFASDFAFPVGGDGSEIYWTSDSTSVGQRGIFKCTIANIGIAATNVYDFGAYNLANLYINSSGKMIVSMVSNRIAVSDNFGSTMSFITIEDMVNSSLASDNNRIINISPVDSRGYIKFTCGGLWFTPRKSVFVKAT